MSGLYSNAGRAAPILRNPGCVVSHNCGSVSLFTGTLPQASPGIGFCLTRQPSASPIVCFIKRSKLCAHEEFDSDLAPLSTPELHIKILQRTALEKQDQVEQDQQY